MKMAKASQADIEMAIALESALDVLESWPPAMPEAIQRINGDLNYEYFDRDNVRYEYFDRDNDEQCGRALRHLLEIIERGSLSRVVYGLQVLLDPANKLVDPDADTLEHHPDAVAAQAQIAELTRQRDELLAALESLVREHDAVFTGRNDGAQDSYYNAHPGRAIAYRIARAVIASVKGAA